MPTPDPIPNGQRAVQTQNPATVAVHIPLTGGLPTTDYDDLPFLSTKVHIIGTGTLVVKFPGNSERIELPIATQYNDNLRIESIYKEGSTGTFTAIMLFCSAGEVEHDLTRVSSFTTQFTTQFF